MSKPPTFESTSIGSAGSGEFASIARSTTSRLRASEVSESPAPRPTRLRASARMSTAATAAEVVVLPMPISPAARRRTPARASPHATAIPTSIARTAPSRDMAEPCAMLPLPRRTFARTMRASSMPRAIPTSTGTTSAPANAAMRQALVAPSHMLRATARVTSCPLCDTPSATTPLSEKNTASARGNSATSALP